MIFCVTGKMAAGKNFASAILEKNGFSSIDCDKVVHDILQEKEFQKKAVAAFSQIAKSRGISLENPDGTLNRRALGKIVFKDKNLLAKQESIVFPELEKRLLDFIEKTENSIINAAVLWKMPNILNMCDCILFVDAPFFKRFFRAKKRDSLPAVQILRRFFAQRNLLFKYSLSNADIYRVKNAGDSLALERKIVSILGEIKQKTFYEGKNESTEQRKHK